MILLSYKEPWGKEAKCASRSLCRLSSGIGGFVLEDGTANAERNKINLAIAPLFWPVYKDKFFCKSLNKIIDIENGSMLQ